MDDQDSRYPLIFRIQRFSIHDGPGIRTTVFMKGCTLCCLWCHNPEGIAPERERMLRQDRCVGCGHCDEYGLDSPEGRETCPSGAISLIGKAYAPRDLCALLLRDQAFYSSSNGGVTFSGGEPLAQDGDYLQAVMVALKARGIHICVDSCLNLPWQAIERVLPYVDLFLADMKALDADLHQRLTGGGNRLILDNLRRLSRHQVPMWLRVPVIPRGNVEDFPPMITWVREHLQVAQINLLPYHPLGLSKREALERPPQAQAFEVPDSALMQTYQRLWTEGTQIPVVVGG